MPVADSLNRRMADSDGPIVAEEFYRRFFECEGGEVDEDFRPDISKSAWALHCAVKKLRDGGVPFVRWVPFVHYGL